MKPLILVSTLLLVAFGPPVDACRHRWIDWQATKSCRLSSHTMNDDCFQIMKNMRDYSEGHSRLWGADFTFENVICGACNGGMKGCNCRVNAWRFREWMYDPGFDKWPQMPPGWSRVDPDAVPNGWQDNWQNDNVDCD